MSDLPIRRGTQENDRLAKLAKPMEETIREFSKARAARLFKGKTTASIETVIVSTMDAMHAMVTGCISACKQAEELKGSKLTKEEYQKACITALLWPGRG